MSAETIGALVGLAVYFGVRLVDAILPNGRHFTFMDRFLRKNDKENDDDLAS